MLFLSDVKARLWYRSEETEAWRPLPTLENTLDDEQVRAGPGCGVYGELRASVTCDIWLAVPFDAPPRFPTNTHTQTPLPFRASLLTAAKSSWSCSSPTGRGPGQASTKVA